MVSRKSYHYDVCIVGGAGHVGLPLSILFATKKKRVLIYDVNKEVMHTIKRGKMPFLEYGAELLLQKTLGKTLFLTSDKRKIAQAESVIVTIGTPVDEFLNPKTRLFIESICNLVPSLHPMQTIIVRSTIYPRTCEQLLRNLNLRLKGDWQIAYCPERTVQGYAIQEIQELPQIVAGLTGKAVKDARRLFQILTRNIIETTIGEAELIKLFTNSWRYIQFAATNQFYMMAQTLGVNYNNIRRAMIESYGRAASLPTAGFAAGPCLLKDTMQLAASHNHHFLLGHAAMMINEGLPNFIVEELRQQYDLPNTKVGILGMAFKADIDDTRDALSYKLGKILRFHGAHVFYSDEFAKDPTFVSKETLVKKSDIIIVGVPHSAYKDLSITNGKKVVDLWGIIHGGEKIL